MARNCAFLHDGSGSDYTITSTPQVPVKTPQIPCNRDQKALKRGTLRLSAYDAEGQALFLWYRAGVCTVDGKNPARPKQYCITRRAPPTSPRAVPVRDPCCVQLARNIDIGSNDPTVKTPYIKPRSHFARISCNPCIVPVFKEV